VKCLCPRCSDQPAPTYIEAWRKECEARYVLHMGKDQRRAYYAGVSKFRGLPAMRELIAAVEKEHESRIHNPR
jgi:hypothetical protein